MEPDERAAKGLFLAFQYPLEIPGVATMTFLRTALNAQRKKRGEAELSMPEFRKKVREAAKPLGIDPEMLRAASTSASPAARRSATRSCRWRCWSRACACSTRPTPASTSTPCKVVSDGVNRLRSPERSMIVITHYQRLLNYIVPDVVHVLSRGRIVKTGTKELALELEAHGYREYQERRRKIRWLT